MDRYLTDEELSREKNLFEPHEISYEILEGRECDIRSFKTPITEGFDMPEIPKAC